jgi:hypothetical protein
VLSDEPEGHVDPIQEDIDLANWLESGNYGYIDPQAQFEFDDDWERESYKNPWPWENLMARWRHRVYELWRLMKHWLY